MSEKPQKPDIEFVVVLQAHSAAGRKWIEERIIPSGDTWSGVVVQPYHAAKLADQAVIDGLWISGWSELVRYEWDPFTTSKDSGLPLSEPQRPAHERKSK